MMTCGTPRTFGSGPPSGSLGELTEVQNGEVAASMRCTNCGRDEKTGLTGVYFYA